jgi:hypothetical protein
MHVLEMRVKPNSEIPKSTFPMMHNVGCQANGLHSWISVFMYTTYLLVKSFRCLTIEETTALVADVHTYIINT